MDDPSSKRKLESESSPSSSTYKTQKTFHETKWITMNTVGIEAQSNYVGKKNPLYFEDITNFIIYAQYSHYSLIECRFAEVEQPPDQIIFLLFDGAPVTDLHTFDLDFPSIKLEFLGFSTHPVPKNLIFLPLISSEPEFLIHKFSTLKSAIKEYENIYGPIKIEFSIDSNNTFEDDSSQTSKEKFLLSLFDMFKLKYPIPSNPKFQGFKLTNDSYVTPSSQSKMYSFDCEMVRTVKKQELAWISIVDEQLNVSYETYVQPSSKIIDYNTKYSGIRRETLENVTTNLNDVQTSLKSVITNDAILAGHSLDSDLRAIEMIHPFILDSSILYNETGKLSDKTKLKKLMMKHFGENVQTSKKGHNPREDAISSMKLIIKKIENGVTFHNAIYSNDELEKNEQFRNTFLKAKKKSMVCADEEITAEYEKHYSMLTDVQTTSRDATQQKCLTNILVSNQRSKEDIVEKICSSVDGKELIIGHINFDRTKSSESISFVKDMSSKIWKALKSNTLIIVSVGDSESAKSSGIAMISYKKNT